MSLLDQGAAETPPCGSGACGLCDLSHDVGPHLHGVALGLSRASVLSELSIAPELLATLHARVDSAKLYALWDRLAAASGDDVIGLTLADENEPDAGGMAVVRFACTSAGSVREVVERAVRFMTIVDDTNPLYVEDESSGVSVGYRGPGHGGLNRYAAQYGLGVLYRIGRAIVTDPWRPVAVRFAHDDAGERAAAARFFDDAVLTFGAPADELVVPHDVMRQPVLEANPVLARVLEGYASRLLDALPKDDLLACARAAVSAALSEGVTLEKIARRFKRSARTLQRRLGQHGTSLNAVVEEVRQARARSQASTSSRSSATGPPAPSRR